MDKDARDYFAEVVRLASRHFVNVRYEIDETPQRVILRLHANLETLRVIVVEIVHHGERKYSYYLLDGSYVLVGFDNSADPVARRLKYGTDRARHIGELVPHAHFRDKRDLVLTEHLTFADFVQWIQDHDLKTLRGS